MQLRLMAVVSIKDLGGVPIAYREFEGNVRLPVTFSANAYLGTPKLKLRESDILIVNWMRSGTHWMFEMTQMLVNNSAATITTDKRNHAFEYASNESLDELPSPRVFNTHLLFSSLPEDLKHMPCKVIYLLRDPRDAMLSFYKLQTSRSHYDYKGKFEDWLPLCVDGKLHWGTWYDHVRNWEQIFEEYHNIKVHFWYFEDMKRNPLQELRKLSDFLGTKTEEGVLSEVISACQIDNMREKKRQHDPNKAVDCHYIRGEVGSWKKAFTVRHFEDTEAIYRQKMKGSKFYTRYLGAIDRL